MICPNISLKEVKDGFNEMVEALGGRPLTDEEFKSGELRNQRTGQDYSAMEAAYRTYHRNNGNMLDKAPNGNDSVLFNSLLEYFGNRAEAIKAKVNVYTDEFFNWFGNWTSEDKEDVSKVVDENGEPKVRYHQTSENFNTFDPKISKRGNYDTETPIGIFTKPEANDIFGDGSKQIPIFVNAKNILKVNTRKDASEYFSKNISGYDDYIKQIRVLDESDPFMLTSPYSYEYTEETKNLINDYLINNNYDGFELVNDEGVSSGTVTSVDTIVVFDGNNVKSAVVNSGKFSVEDNNIYKNISDKRRYDWEKDITRNEVNKINAQLSTIPYKSLPKEKQKELKDKYRSIFKNSKHFRINYGYNKESDRLYAYKVDKDYAAISNWKELIAEASFQDDSNKIDLNKILEHLHAEARGVSYRQSIIVSILKEAFRNKTIYFSFTNTLPDSVGARYDYFSNTIFINSNASFRNESEYEDQLAQTILHELLHAATVQTIQHSPELKSELENLLNTVKTALGEDAKDYGLTDIYEFLAELSNEQFIKKLASIKTNSEKKNYVSERGLLNSVVEFIKKVINRALRHVNQNHRGTAYADATELLLKAVFPKQMNVQLQQESIDDKTTFNTSAQQQKAQRVSEQITERFYVLYKAYERLPNKSPRRQQIQNQIFEKFNELKQTQDYQAVTIALDFALQNLGAWDYTTNEPMKADSISGYLWKQSQLTDPYKDITPERLVEMYQNSIGFYDNLVSNYIPNDLDVQMSAEDKQKAKDVKDVIDRIIKPMWLQAMAKVGDKIVDDIVDQEVFASDQDKEDMKTVAKDWLHKNVMYGDINVVSSYVYNNSYINNPIIKQVFHLIQHAETKTLEELQPTARRITKAYRKADSLFKKIGPNWQTCLMEFDNEGIPTGKFVRDINYGQYEKDLTEFVEKLNKEFKNRYGFYYHDDKTGVVVNSLTGEAADDEEWGPNGEEPTYIKYLKRIEEFKCERANRRYTIDYYNERMSEPYRGSLDPNDVDVNKYGHGLSPKTLSRYNYIQSNINYYLDLCTDSNTGFSHPENLSSDDKKKLDQWYSELDNLSNPYNEDGTPKMDDQRQMAFEIRAWQKWIGEKLSSNINYKAFEEEVDRITQEAQDKNNPRLISDFFKYNSQFGINPDFIEQTIGQFPSAEDTDQAVIHAKLIKRSLQNLVKIQNGYTRDLQKMENNPSFWLDCKHIDQIIEDGRTSQSVEFAKTFEENFIHSEILYRDEHGFAIDAFGQQVDPKDEHLHNDLLTYREYLINSYANLAITNPSHTIPGLNDENGNPIVFNGTADQVKDVMSKLFSYKKERVRNDGTVEQVYVPLSVFTMLYPKKETFYNSRTGRTEKTMLYVPKGRFAEKSDKTGRYMNLEYNHSDLNSEQPKRNYTDNKGNRRYDNSKAWNEMTENKDVHNLYDILIEEMKNAQKNYQTSNRRFNYQLPQINAHTMQIWSRIAKQGLGNTLQALYESATNVEENDESMRTSDDYITNPDGTVATDIPLKFVRKLKNPERITTDIAGSVILFANMALNFKNKSEIDAKIKAIRYNLDFKNRQDLYNQEKADDPDAMAPFDNENSIKMFDSMTNKHVYGNQWTTNPNQPDATEQPKNGSAFTLLKHILGGAAGGAMFGASQGLYTGQYGIGALIGGTLGGITGAATGAIQSGLLEGTAFFKTMKTIQRVETTQMLALNIYSMLVGFGDSTTRIVKESMMNKYMSVRDVVTSFVYCLIETPRCIWNIGNPLANNKLTKAMQLNGISKGTHQIYEHLNYGKVRRIASNLLMGGFSLLDWMANALLMRSFYNNIRFYNGKVIPKGFYSAYEIEQEFIKAGKSKYAAKLAHAMSTTTLWGAYNKDMFVKPKYEQYVTQRIKTLVRSKTLKRGALYNGMNPDNDIPRWKQDLIGSVVGALRSWLAQSTQHLVAGGTDNIVRRIDVDTEDDIRGTKTRTKKRRVYQQTTPEEKARAFAWDYETGTPQDQIWVGIFRSFKTLLNKMFFLATLGKKGINQKFSYVEKYAWKDAIIYLGILAAMMYGWTFMNDEANTVPTPTERKQAAPESLNPSDIYDYIQNEYLPNQYWKLQVNTMAFRLIEAQITSIDPSSASDVVNSLTALKSGLGEHLGILKPISDITGASGHSLDEVNKRGSYKFYTRGERAAYKFFGPLDNLHTAFTYYGTTENLGFYTNTYGGIYRWFGYDFKKPKKEESKGFKGGNFKGTGFKGGNFKGGNFK